MGSLLIRFGDLRFRRCLRFLFLFLDFLRLIRFGDLRFLDLRFLDLRFLDLRGLDLRLDLIRFGERLLAFLRTLLFLGLGLRLIFSDFFLERLLDLRLRRLPIVVFHTVD